MVFMNAENSAVGLVQGEVLPSILDVLDNTGNVSFVTSLIISAQPCCTGRRCPGLGEPCH